MGRGRLGLAKEKQEAERRLFLALRDIGGIAIGSVEDCIKALRHHGLQLRLIRPLVPRPKLMVIGGVCAKGHLLTEDSVYHEGRRDGAKKYIRCKQCIKERYQARQESPQRQILKHAYSHWYHCGHPEGLDWPEIKARILKETNHGQISPVELPCLGPRHEWPEPATACPQSAGVDQLECCTVQHHQHHRASGA